MALEFGMFMTPFAPPDRTPRQLFEWACAMAELGDAYGYTDFMIGEHYTVAWENIPMPDAIIAACARTTSNIRFAPMAHLLPYHDPATLAVRIGWLSQVLEGRYFLGVGAGGFESDALLHGIAGMSDLRARMVEALRLIERVWLQEPFIERGDYFQAGYPEMDCASAAEPIPFLGPYGGRDQLEIAVTGTSPQSTSLAFAGENNYSPISFYLGSELLIRHWETWSEAMERAGHIAHRSRYRLCRDVFVADSDAEARRLFLKSGMARVWREYLRDLYLRFGFMQGFIADSGTGIDPNDIDDDFLADHVVLCGSPETVIEKLERLADKTGGWGQLVIFQHDSLDDPRPWEESLKLIATEVCPKVTLKL